MKKQMLIAALLGALTLSCAPATQGKKDVNDAPISAPSGSVEDKKDMNDTAVSVPDAVAEKQKVAGKMLQEAVVAQDVAKVQSLLKDHADVHVRDEKGNTALMFAAEGGHKEIVQLLLDANAAVNVTNSYGSTPLFKAVREGHVDAARLLLQRGANINVVDTYGKTPLMEASALWYEDMVPMLLQFKPAQDVKDEAGKTAFMHACENGRLEAVELLFDESIPLDMRDDEGKTALFLTVEGYIFGYFHHGPSVGAQTEVAEFLLKHKADHTITDNKGTTVLEMANSIPDGAIIDVLKAYGAR